MSAQELEPGTWITPSWSPTKDMVDVIRLAQQLGMPALVEADERLVAVFADEPDPVNDLMEIRDAAITWLEDHRPVDGHWWGYQPDVLPPADFGLWPQEEQSW